MTDDRLPDDAGSYRVGYGKPPREHRFRAGQSGNPKGRKKGARGLKTDLQAELEARMTIRINNEPVSETRQRLLLRALSSRAAAGDVRAAAILIPIIIQVLGVEDRGGDRRGLSPLDQSILDEMMQSLGVGPANAEQAAADATPTTTRQHPTSITRTPKETTDDPPDPAR